MDTPLFTPSKSPPGKKGKPDNLEKNIDTIQDKTAESVTALTSTVQKLVIDNASHKEKITQLEKNVVELKQENNQLKSSVMEASAYRRRWGLRIHGAKENDQHEDTRNVAIKILAKVVPRIAGKLPDVVDSVHRIGRKQDDGSPRVIIIQFSMRYYRDIMWREAKGALFLEENHMRIKEDLSPEERAAREKTWPLVKARDEGKRASFRGAFAFIEGKRVDING